MHKHIQASMVLDSVADRNVINNGKIQLFKCCRRVCAKICSDYKNCFAFVAGGLDSNTCSIN